VSLAPIRPPRPLIWHPCIDVIRAAIPAGETVYLVGGAVRDAVLHRPMHDVDLATPGDGRPLARRLANAFRGAYYPLDSERGVGRAIISCEGEQITIDVAQFRGPDLLTDLRERDFTLNAMAVNLAAGLQEVIDPMGGLADLAARRLRACTPHAIASDPARILRAIRTSVRFSLMLDPATRDDLKQHAPRLPTVSAERIRDEFVSILGGNRPAAAIAALHQLGILPYIIPETNAMPGVEQGPPHQFDVWDHTLAVLGHLDTVLGVIAPKRGSDTTANLRAGALAFALSHMRTRLQDHLAHAWPNDRSHRAILMLAALLHDAGKPTARRVTPDGSIQFQRHEQIGADLAQQRADALRLSRDEINRITAIILHHMRPHWLHANGHVTSRAIYRFWRDTGAAGVDVCLLALAEYLGTYGVTLDAQDWIAYLNTIQTLLDHYFLHHNTAVAPPPFLTGQDLLDEFDLQPGPHIGEILNGLREAQAIGEITSKKKALEWVQRFLNQHAPKSS
jgi:tRNA nucleotidyltransferase/poly(A) polymerase